MHAFNPNLGSRLSEDSQTRICSHQESPIVPNSVALARHGSVATRLAVAHQAAMPSSVLALRLGDGSNLARLGCGLAMAHRLNGETGSR